MSIGSIARRILGKQIFTRVGRAYRSIFVDLHEVAHSSIDAIPVSSQILDIGGGDGEPLNYFLSLRPDVHVTMIDLSSCIGNAIHEPFLNRVTKMPSTSIKKYCDSGNPLPQVIMINDVLHHVPIEQIGVFFSDLKKLVEMCTDVKIIIKDIEPGSFRSFLSYLADKYISGDSKVHLISKDWLKDYLKSIFNDVLIQETPLFLKDSPNYSLICSQKNLSKNIKNSNQNIFDLNH